MNKLLTILVLSGLSACSSSTYYVPPGQGVFAPKEPEQVAISTQKTIHSNYKPIARVAAITWGGGESAREALQREAAKVGANLIIDFRLEKVPGRSSASGLAVFVHQSE